MNVCPTGSPFVIKVSASPDASLVVARGPGLSDGLLSTYDGQFSIETTGAGAGQLTIRVRGPKGRSPLAFIYS